MTSLWLAMACLAALAAVVVGLPLLRPSRPAAGSDDADAAFYRRQLAEVEADLARGLLSGDAALAARSEVERRLLRLGTRAKDAVSEPGPSTAARPKVMQGGRLLALLLAVAVPAAAFVIYDRIGAPEQPDRPFAQRRGGSAESAGTADGDGDERAMLERALPVLARRLADHPDDRLALEMQSRAQLLLGRYADAAQTMERQQALGDTDPAMLADYGEALVGAEGGTITDTARAAFEKALAADAGNLKARYYLALDHARAGRLDVAIRDLADLIALSPADAPWLPAVRQMLATAAARQGLDPVTIKPRVAPGGTGTAGPGTAPPPN